MCRHGVRSLSPPGSVQAHAWPPKSCVGPSQVHTSVCCKVCANVFVQGSISLLLAHCAPHLVRTTEPAPTQDSLRKSLDLLDPNWGVSSGLRMLIKLAVARRGFNVFQLTLIKLLLF